MLLSRLWRALPGRSPKSALLAVLLALGGVIAAAAAQKAEIGALRPHAIEISTRPIAFDRSKSERRDFGRLEWMGGLILSSRSDIFGGYSGIEIDDKGEQMLAISDAGSWLTAQLVYQDGRLAGVKDAEVGAITQKDGKPIQRRRDRDAESIVALRHGRLEGRFLIGFEGRHRIEEYAFEKGRLKGPVGSRPLPAPLRRMRSNDGLEGMAVLRGGPHAGALVAFSERKLSTRRDHTGALTESGKSQPLYLKRSGEFNITDLASLADGSLLVLERSFIRSALKLDMRLRLIRAADIKPGARLEGEVLLEAGSAYLIDNFEGMAVTETQKGDTIITLISDDNFNFFQSTLLVQFKLK